LHFILLLLLSVTGYQYTAEFAALLFLYSETCLNQILNKPDPE